MSFNLLEAFDISISSLREILSDYTKVRNDLERLAETMHHLDQQGRKVISTLVGQDMMLLLLEIEDRYGKTKTFKT